MRTIKTYSKGRPFIMRLSGLGFVVKTTVAEPPMHYALQLGRHLELNVRILKYPSQ